jgi:hypothetical protein
MYAIVIDPPPKKHQSTQDAYDVAAYIANKYVGLLYDNGVKISLTPTKSICNSIRKHGVTLIYKGRTSFVYDSEVIDEWIDNAGGHYKASKYKLQACE